MVTPALLPRHCFIDIETTGLDAASEEIVEIGAVFVEAGVVVARRQWLVRPTRTLAPMIAALTGLTDAELATAQPLSALRDEVAAALEGWSLVAHNGNFERSFLGELIAAHALLDSCELAQLLFPDRPSHSLDALVKWLGVGAGARHRAVDDAEDTFLMVSALGARFLVDGDSAQLEAVLRQLEPPQSRDRRALCDALRALLVGQPRRVIAPPPAVAVDDALAARLARWAAAPEVVCAELERAPIVELALRAARLAAHPLTVAVPSATFRELSQRPDVPAVARRTLCSSALREALGRPVADELERFGRAYLASWLLRTRTGDLESLSGFVRTRVTGVDALVESVRECRCAAQDCLTRRAGSELTWRLVTHQHALESTRHHALLVVDADRLPDVERRRLQVRLSLRDLEANGVDVTALAAALLEHPAGPVTARARLEPAWHRVEAALQGFSSELTAPFLAPVPRGMELVVREDALMLTPTRVGERLARRLHSRACLLASTLGSLRWAQRRGVGVPPVPTSRVRVITEAICAEALRQLIADTGADVIVSPGPLGPLVESLHAAGVAISLGAQRPGAVRVLEWRREARVTATHCILYGTRDWRSAVLSVNAAVLTLASPQGIDELASRALRGLEPQRVTC